MSTTVASTLFVGLGRMGEPMARRYAATRGTFLHDADPAATARAEQGGAGTGLDALDPLPAGIETVLLMLPTSEVVETVLLGDGLLSGGLLDALPRGALVVDMGSSVPSSTRRLAATAAGLGIDYVDAPVSGGVARARTGELAVMVGGERAAVDRARPHLEPFGTSIVHVGPPGAGHAAKALNNLLSATNLAAVAEVLSVAQRVGIDPAVMTAVVNASTGRSQASEVKIPQHVLTGSFGSGFELDLMVKDLGIARALVEEVGGCAPVTAAAATVAREARQHVGRPGADHTELVRHVEEANGARLRTGPPGPTGTDHDDDDERNHP